MMNSKRPLLACETEKDLLNSEDMQSLFLSRPITDRVIQKAIEPLNEDGSGICFVEPGVAHLWAQGGCSLPETASKWNAFILSDHVLPGVPMNFEHPLLFPALIGYAKRRLHEHVGEYIPSALEELSEERPVKISYDERGNESLSVPVGRTKAINISIQSDAEDNSRYRLSLRNDENDDEKGMEQECTVPMQGNKEIYEHVLLLTQALKGKERAINPYPTPAQTDVEAISNRLEDNPALESESLGHGGIAKIFGLSINLGSVESVLRFFRKRRKENEKKHAGKTTTSEVAKALPEVRDAEHPSESIIKSARFEHDPCDPDRHRMILCCDEKGKEEFDGHPFFLPKVFSQELTDEIDGKRHKIQMNNDASQGRSQSIPHFYVLLCDRRSSRNPKFYLYNSLRKAIYTRDAMEKAKKMGKELHGGGEIEIRKGLNFFELHIPQQSNDLKKKNKCALFCIATSNFLKSQYDAAESQQSSFSPTDITPEEPLSNLEWVMGCSPEGAL